MSLRRIYREAQKTPTGFTRWVSPRMENYIMVCCDCGLAHQMQFKVGKVASGNVRRAYTLDLLPITKYRVMFRARRAPRYTARQRARRASTTTKGPKHV